MATITIPKKLIKDDDLIILPRREYEEYLRLRKIIPLIKMTTREKQEWKRAKKDYKEGRCIAFEELEYELGTTNKRKS